MFEKHRLKYLQRLVEKQRSRIECLEGDLRDLHKILKIGRKPCSECPIKKWWARETRKGWKRKEEDDELNSSEH